MTFLQKYLKWISTFLVLTGILLTNLNIYNNRKDSSTLFSSALGNQLLDPISEAGINIALDEELVYIEVYGLGFWVYCNEKWCV